MSERRLYLHLRRAYFPRLWPMVLVAIPLNLVLLWLLQPRGALLFAIPLGIGVGVPAIRVAVFLRRHPPMTAEEYLQRCRNSATWN